MPADVPKMSVEVTRLLSGWNTVWQTCLGNDVFFLLALLALLALGRVSGTVSESGRLHALLAGVSS